MDQFSAAMLRIAQWLTSTAGIPVYILMGMVCGYGCYEERSLSPVKWLVLAAGITFSAGWGLKSWYG